MSCHIRNTSEKLSEIIQNDSDNLTEAQRKVLRIASDILYWESVSRFNAYHEERMIENNYQINKEV